MRLDRVAYLVTIPSAEDEAGYPIVPPPEPIKREVFARDKGVRQSEFYAANQSGFKADLTLEVRKSEYRGERYIEYEKKRYEIFRTFPSSDQFLELVCTDLSQKGK